MQSSFYKFLTATDAVAALDGISSAVNLIDSDASQLWIVMDTNLNYHISQLGIGLHDASAQAHVSIITMDTDSMDTDGTYTQWCEEFDFHTPAAPSGRTNGQWFFDPPITIPSNGTYSIISMRLELNDSDTIPNLSYGGFTTPAWPG
jgi:hypothetical protein